MSNLKKMMEARPAAMAAWAAVIGALCGVLTAGCEERGGSSIPFLQKSAGSGSGSDFVVPKPDEIVEDKETGLMVVRGVLNIHFSPKLPPAEAEKIIAENGGKIVGYDHSVNFYQAKFPLENEAMEKKIQELLAKKGVETVAKTSVSVHKDPYYAK